MKEQYCECLVSRDLDGKMRLLTVMAVAFAVLFAFLLGLISYHSTAMNGGKGVLFTIFVLFQFWNLFNARAFSTGRSAFHLKGCKGFVSIAAAIFFGQIIIMNLMPDFFNVEPIGFLDWIVIIVATSVVLIAGEIVRLFSRS